MARLHIRQTIRVDVSYGARQAAETLLHEILHCAFAVFPIYEKDEEERIVKGMSACLATIWRDNADVLSWIGEAIVAGDELVRRVE
jgi:hypothetical protein